MKKWGFRFLGLMVLSGGWLMSSSTMAQPDQMRAVAVQFQIQRHLTDFGSRFPVSCGMVEDFVRTFGQALTGRMPGVICYPHGYSRGVDVVVYMDAARWPHSQDEAWRLRPAFWNQVQVQWRVHAGCQWMEQIGQAMVEVQQRSGIDNHWVMCYGDGSGSYSYFGNVLTVQ